MRYEKSLSNALMTPEMLLKRSDSTYCNINNVQTLQTLFAAKK